MSDRSFTSRLRRRVIAAALFLLIGGSSLGLASVAGASPRGERPAASFAARPAPQATASSGIGTVIKALMKRIRFQGTSVVRPYVLRTGRQYTLAWLTNRYCSAWYRYFGFNARTWRYYAYYYANARWAWNYCSMKSWRYVA